MHRFLIRYAAYPLIFGAAALAVLALAERGTPSWVGFLAVAVPGAVAVALLERIQPYQTRWLRDHGDTGVDVLHLLVNLGLLAGTAFALHALRDRLPHLEAWPHVWPLWAQILLAGTAIDFGLYLMHRLSHRVPWLWRLHAVHHSAERLYWMNGERRHPLSAILLAGPGIAVVVLLGASPAAVSAWLSLLAVHLAFQHANLDYTVGPLRHVLGVAEIHRWHHKREYEDAQVNFGEFWMIWDRLFGSFHDRRNGLGEGEVGLRDRHFPATYLAQLRWPLTRAPRANAEERA